jgi:alginate O-acetyltransferase complex protein AlgI
MLFVEFRFIIFFLVVWVLFWSLRSNDHRKWLLLSSSYFFYASWDYRFLSLIFLSTIVNHVAALRIHASSVRTERFRWLMFSLSVNLFVLFVFKYFNFFTDSFVQLLDTFGGTVDFPFINIILPVGISFYTFQGLSYPLDVYHKTMEPRRRLLDSALFLAFFPQLVAGPIVRAKVFLPQLDVFKKLSEIPIRSCLTLFLIGFTKKAVVADSIAPYMDRLFDNPTAYGTLDIFYGQLLYSIQIYCDFSGYSDMAIASAGLLGYTIPINFAFPYFSSNLTEFWRRWHISLSSWLHDYLYLPLFFLGKNRFTKMMIYRNVMITMLLCGLWHGAAWGYIIFGLIHGVGLVLVQEWQDLRKKHNIHIPFDKMLGMIITFYWVCGTITFFRISDISVAWYLTLGNFFSNTPSTESLPANAPLVFLFLAAIHACFYNWDIGKWFANLRPTIFTISFGALTALIVSLVPIGYRPFIYFQF